MASFKPISSKTSLTPPDGIFKPISDKILSHLQMESLSPFPQLCFDECKFLGTLVSNHLLPSSRERQNCQSNSSGLRILNRGNCCTPKFSLPFFQDISHKDFQKGRFSQVQLDFWLSGIKSKRSKLSLIHKLRLCI